MAGLMNETPQNAASSPAATGARMPRYSMRAFARPAVAWVVLAMCLFVTGIAWQVSLHQLNRRTFDRFRLHM